MIPEFPKFKKLELSDKKEVEAFTCQFPPYSDFNFVSMWSWDIKGEMRLSQLHGNLIVRFTDYLTGEPFYSFLGSKKVNETVEALLELSKEEKVKPILKLIPTESARNLDTKKFILKEDRNHFDYTYDLKKLSQCAGSEYSTKRSEINRFLRDNKNVKIEIIDLRQPQTRLKISKLNDGWIKHKNKDPFLDIRNELIAIEKFLNLDFNHSASLGIFINDELAAYAINEVFPSSKYAVGHFYKAYKAVGLFDYLMKESSNLLSKMEIKFMNFEQDLGKEGLRRSKISYRPVDFLKKFTIEKVS